MVYEGEIKLSSPQMPEWLPTLMKWADDIRTLGVRTNADTPHDARKARELGAQGIGLCRTEHMFFKDFEQPKKAGFDRRLAIQEMIVADLFRRPGARLLISFCHFSGAISSASLRP